MARCSDLCSPISHLPLEILQTIFVLSLSSQRKSDSADIPLSLCHVCRTWRAAAFGDPRLWNALALSLSRRTPAEALIQLSRLSFHHAKNMPISLSLDFFGSGNVNKEDDRVGQVIDNVVMAHSNRFVELSLLSITTANFHRFLMLPQGHVDQLECLTLQLYGLADHTRPITVFQSAPRLQSVLVLNFIYNKWFDLDALPLRLPWDQLTHLDIREDLPYESWHSLFRRCTRLERCFFRIHSSASSHLDVNKDTTRSPVSFPSLLELSLCTTRLPNESFGTGEFSFPALAELDLQLTEIDASWIEASRHTLRFQALRRLTLDHCVISIDDIIVFLDATPMLSELSLGLKFIVNTEDQLRINFARLSEALTIKHTDDTPKTNLVTRLEVLELWTSFSSEWGPPVECLEMIKSRWGRPDVDLVHVDKASSTRLGRVSLHLHVIREETVQGIMDHLEPCRAEGLIVGVDTLHRPDVRYRTRDGW